MPYPVAGKDVGVRLVDDIGIGGLFPCPLQQFQVLHPFGTVPYRGIILHLPRDQDDLLVLGKVQRRIIIVVELGEFFLYQLTAQPFGTGQFLITELMEIEQVFQVALDSRVKVDAAAVDDQRVGLRQVRPQADGADEAVFHPVDRNGIRRGVPLRLIKPPAPPDVDAALLIHPFSQRLLQMPFARKGVDKEAVFRPYLFEKGLDKSVLPA